DLFVNRNYLLTRAADIERYLPPSDGDFAYLQNFSVTASGNTASSGTSRTDYTVGGVSLLSWRENSIYGSWDYTKDQNLIVDRLYAQREFEGVAWQGGMISSRGFGLNFTSDQTLLGGRVATSDSTRLDTQFTGGTPLDVFLPTRGRVELRRDGKLLASQFFEAGNQALNTSSLPDGAYNLDIRIIDDLGVEVSRETRFFAKQNRLPAPGEWTWFMEAGDVLNRVANATLPETTGQILGRGGVGRRLGDTWSGTLAFAADNDESLIEAGLFHVGSFWDISPYGMVDNAGNHGAGMGLRTQIGVVSLNNNYRRLWKRNRAPADSVSAVTSTSASTYDNKLLGDSFEQINSSISLPLSLDDTSLGSVSYRYNSNRQQ
ncbi:TcfC E-set like domain-containing protein, partial [Sansalvadorimonas verongulae]|uniref:TcfC E-set like domain-containing protein n=1 Tax=Sansalvadorimonas verongulae TaxID=2172824 RepID=UPI0018AD2660